MGRGSNEDQLVEGNLIISNPKWLKQARIKLASTGLDLYEVGGALRDELSGKQMHDLDICVVGSDHEKLISKLSQLGNVQPLEVASKVIGARIYAPFTPKEGIELALARKEVSTGNGHQDFAIESTPEVTLEEDLLRRDFTVNALARKINSDGSVGEIIDMFDGQKHIREKTLHPVSPTTITEDPLRTLRGMVRMSKDGLKPSFEAIAAMKEDSYKLRPEGPLSAERVFQELNKILEGNYAADALRFARDEKIYQDIFPELENTIGFEQHSKYHSLTVDEHCLTALQRACEMDAPLEVRWAALLHDSGKPTMAWKGKDGNYHYYRNPNDSESLSHEEEGAIIARKVMDRLKAPNDVKEKTVLLIKHHMFREDDSTENIDPKKLARKELKTRRLIKRVGRDNIDDLLLLRRCDRAGKQHNISKDFYKQFIPFEQIVEKQKNNPIEIKDLDINGHDLMSIGLKGPGIGKTQRELLSRVITNPESNKKERLVTWARKIYQGI